jgi:hypothetical protein
MTLRKNTRGCLRLFVSGMGREEESPTLTLNQDGALNLHVPTREGILPYLQRRKEASVKRPQPIVRVMLIIAVTIIALTLIMQRTVCEIYYRSGSQEVHALLDCKPERKQ